jgi:hypothetical protein
MAKKASQSKQEVTQAPAKSTAPNVGVMRAVLDGADKVLKAARAQESLLAGRPPVPASPLAGTEKAPEVLTTMARAASVHISLLDRTLTTARGAVGSATTTKAASAVDIQTSRAQLKKVRKLFDALREIDDATYAGPYSQAFPHDSAKDFGATDPATIEAVHRVLGAIEALPPKEQGALHAMIGPLHTLDVKLHQTGADAGAAYAALRDAEARVERDQRLLRLGVALQYADAPAAAAKLTPATKAKGKAKSKPAPVTPPPPTPPTP